MVHTEPVFMFRYQNNFYEKIRVLIVEDDPITAMSECEIVGGLGYEVSDIVFTGETAV